MGHLSCGKFSVALILLLLLSACSTGYAPVSVISSRNHNSIGAVQSNSKRITAISPNNYRVRSGDTLYSIAWKYGLDFKQLARENNINNNYIIYTGQLLKTSASKQHQKVSLNKATTLNNNESTSAKRDTTSASKKINVAKSSRKLAKTSSNKKIKQQQSSASSKVKKFSKIVWGRPAKGKIINVFNSGNKGLDFEGNLGDPVFAAASGRVVYAGNGIIGYGNLIIIKHSAEYLSAYAHNSVIFIDDQKTIKQGEKIAEIGSTGIIKTMLHFEIRRDGKPVNPLQYLPEK